MLFRSAFRRYTGKESRTVEDVFTLEPQAIHSSRLSALENSAEEPLPPELSLAANAMTSISVRMSIMLGREPITHDVPPGWVDKFQMITDWLAQESRNSHQKRSVTDVQFIADVRGEMTEAAIQAGMTVEELKEWITGGWQNDVATMPSLGLYREVLHEKQVNSRTAWKANDLTDLMYLSCGAGYADYVVGERSSISQLRQSNRRLKRPDNLYKNLSDLVSSGVLDSL